MSKFSGSSGSNGPKAKSLSPPSPSRIVQSGDNYGSKGRGLVQFKRGGEYVFDEFGADAQTLVALVDCETPDEQCRNGVRRALGQLSRGLREVNPRHRERGVGHDSVFAICDDPRRRRVPPTALTGEPLQPVGIGRFNADKLTAVVHCGV